MATIVYPDGHIETGADHSRLFTVFASGMFARVPSVRAESGYTVYVDDEGLLIPLPTNPLLQRLCGYAPLVGPGFITSHEEAGEDELLHRVDEKAKVQFERALAALSASRN